MFRLAPTGKFRLPVIEEIRLVSLVLIMAFTVVELAVVFLADGAMDNRWIAVGVVLCQAGLLLLVPSHPVAAGIGVVMLGGLVLGVGPTAGTGLAPAAVFTASALHPGRRSRAAGVTMLAIAPLGLVRGSGADVLLCGTVAIAAWSLGALVRSQRSRRAEALRSELRLQRSALARDVHDIVGHSLALIIVQAGAADDGFDHDPAAARTALRNIDESARSALGEVRRVVAGITRQHELTELEDLSESVSSAGMTLQLRITGDPNVVPEPIADAVYRVAREAVTNAIRHSGGRMVRIDVRCGPFSVDLWITDDGEGGRDDAADAGVAEGHGIAGMAELVERLGGSLEAGPGRNGFVVRARFGLRLSQVPRR